MLYLPEVQNNKHKVFIDRSKPVAGLVEKSRVCKPFCVKLYYFNIKRIGIILFNLLEVSYMYVNSFHFFTEKIVTSIRLCFL